LFPNIIFVRPVRAAAAERCGYGLYQHSEKPELGRYEEAVELNPVKNEDGVWTQSWQVVEVSEARRQGIDASQAAFKRHERNVLLAQTDWTQAKDISNEMSNLWAPYRQALRDVPEQPGFPWDVSWPEAP
jgi:hypothetical protein